MADLDRKARLAAIRQNAAKGKADTAQDSQIPVKFRNYQPQDSVLQKQKRAHAEMKEGSGDKDGSDSAPVVESQNKRAKNSVVANQDVISQELKEMTSDKINIVPKKPNWDLKKQVSSKIDKLRRNTQRAIVGILREKVASEEGNDDID